MTKRKVVSLSLYEEEVKMLEKICDQSGMTASELIRTAVEKIYTDPVELTILMQKFLKKEAAKISKERLLRIMSIRSTIKKCEAMTQRTAPQMSVSEDRNNNSNWEKYGLGENPYKMLANRTLELLPDD